MMGTMSEETAEKIMMMVVETRERQKKWYWRYGRNEGPSEINFREERGDDGYGGRDAGQWI